MSYFTIKRKLQLYILFMLNLFFPVLIEEAPKGDAANKVGAGEDAEVGSSFIFVSVLVLIKLPYSF